MERPVDTGLKPAPAVWVDGEIKPLADAGLSPVDRGVSLGDGLFETFRIEPGGWARRLDRHLARMAAAARWLDFPPVALDPAEIAAAAAELARDNALLGEPAAARLMLTRAIAPRGLAPPVKVRPTLAMTVSPAPRPSGPRRLALSPVRRNPTAPSSLWKTLSYVDQVAARAIVAARGPDARPTYARDAALHFDEALQLDVWDRVACASAANIFWIHGARLYTPSRACGVLPGVTRAVVLGLARRAGVEVEEGEFALAHLAGADAAFVTSSLAGVAAGAELGTPGAAHRFDPAHPLLALLAQAERRAG